MPQPQDIIAAIKSGDAARVRELLRADRALANTRTDGGLSVVLLATYFGRADIAHTLIEYGASVDLFEACAVGDAARVAALIDQRPDQVNGFARDGFTPLGLAAFFGHRAIVELLLARGADPNRASSNNQRVAPIHSASAGRHIEIARALIARGADVNAHQTGGFTPIHNAAQNGQIEMIELLIANGADANARADDGKTPLAFALAEDHLDAAAILRKQIAQ